MRLTRPSRAARRPAVGATEATRATRRDTDTGMSHIGFRCIRRDTPNP
jgi:hypothetical protein